MAAGDAFEPIGLPDVFEALYQNEMHRYSPWLAINSEDDEPSMAQAVLDIEQGIESPFPNGMLHLIQDRADIDISSAAFDFVRTIRVIDIDYRVWLHESGDGDINCRHGRRRMQQGVYGAQGEFRWEAFDRNDPNYPPSDWLPFQIRMEQRCPVGSFRGVGVEWRDHEGNHSYEVVRY
ncbi:hypothetical protein [Gymnodinialimonas mytili]|uniref:hypothetical protein n=1 Tax=Gymnodinialimonas mytili TaxID=3126503 RepID=UPI0030ED3C52